jgi:uncharacterized protein YidB (DUF937 family)
MGMFDGLIGGIIGGGMVSVLNNIIEQHGGLQAVVQQFEQNGLGPTVQSWIGHGTNQPITPEDLTRVFGPELMQKLSEKSGMSTQDLAQKLAQVLPHAIDKATPNGTL